MGSASEDKGNTSSSEAGQSSKTLQTIFDKFKQKAETLVLHAPASEAQTDSTSSGTAKGDLNWLTGGL